MWNVSVSLRFCTLQLFALLFYEERGESFCTGAGHTQERRRGQGSIRLSLSLLVSSVPRASVPCSRQIVAMAAGLTPELRKHVWSRVSGQRVHITNVPFSEEVQMRNTLEKLKGSKSKTVVASGIAALQKKYSAPNRFTSDQGRSAVLKRNKNMTSAQMSGLQQSIGLKAVYSQQLATDLFPHNLQSFPEVADQEIVEWMSRRDALLIGIARKALQFLPKQIKDWLFISAGTLLGQVYAYVG